MVTFWVSYLLLIPFFNSSWIRLHAKHKSETPNTLYYVGLNVIVSFLVSIPIFNFWQSKTTNDSIFVILIKYLISGAIADVYFYLSHRLMHTKHFYTYHSVHHRVLYPRAYTCVYCHWIEMILCNIPTIIIGPLLVDMSLASLNLWMFIVCFNTMYGHSGGEFSFLWKNKHHYLHHTKINGNYGMSRYTDGIMSTMLSIPV
jgi:sterol desaturase/sphingolipid hydroxylase (fatty acid hydroxylase superfamily)